MESLCRYSHPPETSDYLLLAEDDTREVTKCIPSRYSSKGLSVSERRRSLKWEKNQKMMKEGNLGVEKFVGRDKCLSEGQLTNGDSGNRIGES